jgi:hypothetical protein
VARQVATLDLESTPRRAQAFDDLHEHRDERRADEHEHEPFLEERLPTASRGS